jgi:hypothetical protein
MEVKEEDTEEEENPSSYYNSGPGLSEDIHQSRFYHQQSGFKNENSLKQSSTDFYGLNVNYIEDKDYSMKSSICSDQFKSLKLMQRDTKAQKSGQF